jgi:hypothetical protein
MRVMAPGLLSTSETWGRVSIKGRERTKRKRESREQGERTKKERAIQESREREIGKGERLKRAGREK